MSPNENEPRLLLDPRSEETVPVLRDALTLARAELPGADDLASIAAGLPLGGPGGAGPGSAGPGPGGTSGPGKPDASPPNSSARLPTSPTITTPPVPAGWLAGAALGAVVIAAALLWGPFRERPHAPTANPDTTALSPAAPAISIAPAAPEPLGTAVPAAPAIAPAAPEPLETPPPALAAPPPTASPSSPIPSPSPQLSQPSPRDSTAIAPATAPAVPSAAPTADPETEVHLLQRAREALTSDAATALTLTQLHAARFPSGALGQEREVVAIQALVQLGRRDEARARAARFLSAFPGSAHRPRLEALLGP